MEIRPATIDDVGAVIPMVQQISAMHQEMDPSRYCYRDNVGEMYRHWLEERAQDPSSVFLVAQRESGPPALLAGFLIATREKEIPIYRIEYFGCIHDLWVEETYRHEGLGRDMVMLCVDRFRQIGVAQVRLDTAPANDAARSLFRTCGFRACNVEMLFELNAPKE
jgi:ribosomal protein S18 acetylase RimI-like enzyme